MLSKNDDGDGSMVEVMIQKVAYVRLSTLGVKFTRGATPLQNLSINKKLGQKEIVIRTKFGLVGSIKIPFR